MQIRYLGGSRFVLQDGDRRVLIEPTAPPASSSESPHAGGASMVLLGEGLADEDRRARRAAFAPAFVIDGPGEYEVGGTFVIGVPVLTADGGMGTAFSIDLGELTVCHLGPAGAPPPSEDLAELGAVDLLLVPIGDEGRLAPAAAAEVVGELEPSFVIPMAFEGEEAALRRFAMELGAAEDETAPREALELRANELPDEPTVVILAAAGG